MPRVFIAFLLLWSVTSLANNTAYNLEVAKERCQTHFANSAEVLSEDFHWGYTLLEMEDRFGEIYDSGKRLFQHSYYDQQTDQFFLFFDDKKGLPVPIDANFIRSVTNQIEVAIEKGYASFVFFPDMGHSHLYFPEKHWEKEYTGEKETKDRKDLYVKMFADPMMRPLYHLAEQLQMQNEDKSLIQDQALLFKYWHRNFVGKNDGSLDHQIELAPADNKFNTVGSIEGFHLYSAGFAVSASKDGCFPYRDKDGVTRYFDIGLSDPRYIPSSNSAVEY